VPKAVPDPLYSFARSYRLKSRKDFQAVFAAPQRISHDFLLALFRANHLSYARLGVIVSKRIVKRAVVRNRLKRVIRECFRLNKATLCGRDVIIMIRGDRCSLSKEALRTRVDALLTLFQKRPLW
jgi:ribonuclease P protein component